MALPDSAPEELRILEGLHTECLSKLKSKIPLEEKMQVLNDIEEIQKLQRQYLDAWRKQARADVQKASEELSRQAAKFGLKWPR